MKATAKKATAERADAEKANAENAVAKKVDAKIGGGEEATTGEKLVLGKPKQRGLVLRRMPLRKKQSRPAQVHMSDVAVKLKRSNLGKCHKA